MSLEDGLSGRRNVLNGGSESIPTAPRPQEITNNKKNTPLHEAARLGKSDLTQLLIENGANLNIINNTGKTPLDLAKSVYESDYIKTANILKANGAKTAEELQR